MSKLFTYLKFTVVCFKSRFCIIFKRGSIVIKARQYFVADIWSFAFFAINFKQIEKGHLVINCITTIRISHKGKQQQQQQKHTKMNNKTINKKIPSYSLIVYEETPIKTHSVSNRLLSWRHSGDRSFLSQSTSKHRPTRTHPNIKKLAIHLT